MCSILCCRRHRLSKCEFSLLRQGRTWRRKYSDYRKVSDIFSNDYIIFIFKLLLKSNFLITVLLIHGGVILLYIQNLFKVYLTNYWITKLLLNYYNAFPHLIVFLFSYFTFLIRSAYFLCIKTRSTNV